MAILYKVKDGPKGDQTDQGSEISTTDLATKLSSYQCRYLGSEPTQFNSDKPSDYYRHIVVEVNSDSELNEKFDKKGFYVVADLDASQAGFLYQ